MFLLTMIYIYFPRDYPPLIVRLIFCFFYLPRDPHLRLFDFFVEFTRDLHPSDIFTHLIESLLDFYLYTFLYIMYCRINWAK